MPDALTPKQRALLRGLGHELKPLLHLGKEGLTDDTVGAALDALRTRELLKVRVLETAPDDARTSAHALAARIPEAHVVQVVGRIAVLYRPHPDAPQIRLPQPRKRSPPPAG